MNKINITTGLAALLFLVWLPYLTANYTAQFLADKLYNEDEQRKLCVNFLQCIQEAHPKENVLFSPHSIHRALLLADFVLRNWSREVIEEYQLFARIGGICNCGI